MAEASHKRKFASVGFAAVNSRKTSGHNGQRPIQMKYPIAAGMRFKEPNKRYYFELRRRTRRFRVDLTKKKWCDLWHHHFDWEGFGNRGWIHRRHHLSALLVALSRARNELATSSKPYQLFALVNAGDAGSDAIYVHTENPNGTEFPLKHSGRVLHSLPPLLAGRVDLNKYRVFAQSEGKERCYIIEPK